MMMLFSGAVRLTLTLNMMALCGFMMCLFLGCDNVRMAGATLPYFNGYEKSYIFIHSFFIGLLSYLFFIFI